MWNGVFSPVLSKSIGFVRYVPLEEMTAEDLRILEYENLRNRAKNRLAELIVRGELAGFYHVNVLEKGKAKPNYYWPVKLPPIDGGDDPEPREPVYTYPLPPTGDNPPPDPSDFFQYEPEDDDLTPAARDIDFLIYNISLLSLVRLAGLIARLIENSEGEEREKLSEMQREDGRYSKEDIIFMVTVILLRHYTYEEALEIIERE